ncbi:MAG: hypothetical protein AAF653_19750 [Chloroflexota bacterium]
MKTDRSTAQVGVFLTLAALVMVIVAGCRGRGITPDDIPTLIPSIEDYATSEFMTENAPPPGFRDAVAFPQVDENLRELEGWRYVMLLEFEGVFSQTNRPTVARAEATVWYNQLGSARRVLVESSGDLLQRPEGELFEAVSLGPDAFLVRNQNCLANAEEDARTAASIAAGELLGGVRRGLPTGQRAIINNVESWRYDFAVEDMNLPAVRFAEDTTISDLSAELWVAPEFNAVSRYWVTLQLNNGRLLSNDLPVVGELRLRFDLYDVGDIPNISVPFGC